MIGGLGSVFGFTVRVARPNEWTFLVAAARAAGGVEIGEATRTDYDIVFNERAGIMFINPAKEAEIMDRLRAVCQEEPR